MTADAPHRTHPNYVGIFFVLIFFTALEIGVAYAPMAKPLMVVLLVLLAMTKALLVAMYYMHLRFEPRLLLLIVLSPFILALILTLALMPDIAFKR